METLFSPLQVNGGFLLPRKPEFWSNLPQSLMQPFPHPSDATHKIWSRLANWLQRYSSLKVWMTTDVDWRRQTDDGSLVYCKLILWAFGSGELKILIIFLPLYHRGKRSFKEYSWKVSWEFIYFLNNLKNSVPVWATSWQNLFYVICQQQMQISLHFHAVWSASLLFTPKIDNTYYCIKSCTTSY